MMHRDTIPLLLEKILAEMRGQTTILDDIRAALEPPRATRLVLTLGIPVSNDKEH